jgi:hypothetical protein
VGSHEICSIGAEFRIPSPKKPAPISDFGVVVSSDRKRSRRGPSQSGSASTQANKGRDKAHARMRRQDSTSVLRKPALERDASADRMAERKKLSTTAQRSPKFACQKQTLEEPWALNKAKVEMNKGETNRALWRGRARFILRA